MRRAERWTLALAAPLLPGLAGCTATQAQAPPPAPDPAAVRFEYTYRRPPGLPPLPGRIAFAVPARKEGAGDAASLEKRALSLAAALGRPLPAGKAPQRKRDAAGEVLRLTGGSTRLKVYLPSGMVRFRDSRYYNREDLPGEPLGRERAVAESRRILSKVAAAGLLSEKELLYDAVRLSSRMAQSGPGAPEGSTGRKKFDPARAVDTRVFVPRVLSGVAVSGQGVRLTFAPGGRLAGLDLLWRELGVEAEAQPLAVTPGQARERFEKAVSAPPGASVNVSVNELVYYDPSMREPVGFLEPAYLFVYEVRTPIAGRDEFRVSKRLHHVVSALDHDRRQVVSPRDQRLQRLEAKLRQERPPLNYKNPNTREGEENEVPPPKS